MEAIDVFFSGTPQQFAAAVNSLVGSRLLPKTGKIVFNVSRKDSDSVLIRVQTPDPIEHAHGESLRGSYIAEIEAHTVPTGACVTLRETGFAPEHWEAALHWWEVLLSRLRFEGWQVWTAGEPAQAERDEDAPKIGRPRTADRDPGDPLREVMEDELRKYLRWRLREHKSQEDAANLVGRSRRALEDYRKTPWGQAIEDEIRQEIEAQRAQKVRKV
jgi:hypothetical protein